MWKIASVVTKAPELYDCCVGNILKSVKQVSQTHQQQPVITTATISVQQQVLTVGWAGLVLAFAA